MCQKGANERVPKRNVRKNRDNKHREIVTKRTADEDYVEIPRLVDGAESEGVKREGKLIDCEGKHFSLDGERD